MFNHVFQPLLTCTLKLNNFLIVDFSVDNYPFVQKLYPVLFNTPFQAELMPLSSLQGLL